MYERSISSLDFSSAPNRLLALSYRLGWACLVSLLLWPVALFIVMVLTVIFDAHDMPPGGDIVFGIAAAATVFPGVGGAVLAIVGSALMYAKGGGGRGAILAGLRGVLALIPASVSASLYISSVCWI